MNDDLKDSAVVQKSLIYAHRGGIHLKSAIRPEIIEKVHVSIFKDHPLKMSQVGAGYISKEHIAVSWVPRQLCLIRTSMDPKLIRIFGAFS